DGLRSSGLATANAGVPTDAMRGGDFGEVCPANENVDDNGNAHPGAWNSIVGDPNFGRCVQADDMTTLVPSGQIWDPYSGVSGSGGPTRTRFVPFNNLATYISPGSPNLPANLQPAPGVAGNLIDPVAQKMMNLFPEPNTDGSIYQNWFGSGS